MKVISEVNKNYPNNIESAIALNNNVLQNALNYLITYVSSKKTISPIICVSEDDIVIPVSTKSQYGCFLDHLEEAIASKTFDIVGVSLSLDNHYSTAEKALIENSLLSCKEYSNFVVCSGIPAHYMTMDKNYFMKLSNELKRIPLDSELCEKTSKEGKFISGQLKVKAAHLAWYREMDYPDYYNLLIQQRVQGNWQALRKSRDSTQDLIVAEFKGSWAFNNQKITYTWEI
jgi:hypothetical protein